ncbi:MAG: SRPBCC family protein, partial [Acidimicrobiia bacterium]
AFEVTSGPVKIARWTYRFEPTATGCEVTEIWTDQRSWLPKALGKPISGVADRATHNRESMEKTLEGLARLTEASG